MNYSPQLDGLRALAAWLVLMFHAKAPGMSAGFLGVDIFFVLSGFLITQLLKEEFERTGQINFWRFTRNRLTRLYPALILFILTYLAISPYFWPGIPAHKHAQDAVLSGIYMADYARAFGDSISIITHTWTLAVEQKFYLLAPLLIPFLFRMQKNLALLTLAGVFALSTEWRIFNLRQDDYRVIYERFDTHASGLLLGVLIGFANLRLPERWGWIGVGILGWTVLTSDWRSHITGVFGFTMAEIASAMIICGRPAVLGAGILPWLGRMSYGFYLWHFLFIRLCRTVPELGWQEHLLIGATGGMLGAVISYYTIEAYFRKSNWRERNHSTPQNN